MSLNDLDMVFFYLHISAISLCCWIWDYAASCDSRRPTHRACAFAGSHSATCNAGHPSAHAFRLVRVRQRFICACSTWVSFNAVAACRFGELAPATPAVTPTRGTCTLLVICTSCYGIFFPYTSLPPILIALHFAMPWCHMRAILAPLLVLYPRIRTCFYWLLSYLTYMLASNLAPM